MHELSKSMGENCPSPHLVEDDFAVKKVEGGERPERTTLQESLFTQKSEPQVIPF